MSPREEYFAKQEFDRFEEIMNTKEYLSQEEYDFCFSYDKNQFFKKKIFILYINYVLCKFKIKISRIIKCLN